MFESCRAKDTIPRRWCSHSWFQEETLAPEKKLGITVGIIRTWKLGEDESVSRPSKIQEMRMSTGKLRSQMSKSRIFKDHCKNMEAVILVDFALRRVGSRMHHRHRRLGC